MTSRHHTADLVAKVQTDNRLTAAEAKRQVDNVLLAILNLTQEPESTLTLRKFGVFTQKVRPARIGRNPQTGAAISIPEKSTLRFKAARP